MKRLIIICLIFSMIQCNVFAAEIPPESLPSNASFECMEYTETLIMDILDKVQNGFGFSDARAEARRRFFILVVNGQSNGYSFSQLSEIASNAIFQYRDMYLRPEFYTQNEDKVRYLISDVLEEYKLGRMDYDGAKKRAYEKIYQSIDASFDYDREFSKDTCYRNIPSVDNSLFTIARKLILAERTPVYDGCSFYVQRNKNNGFCISKHGIWSPTKQQMRNLH